MRLFLSLMFLFAFINLTNAQEDPYQIALQRIQEAEARNARGLDLSELGLTELPPEIGSLSNLEMLSIRGNQLISLPSEIGNLSYLVYLALSYNQLVSLPPEIGNLKNLRTLELTNNELSSLPPEIGNLSNLEILFLSRNDLNRLPPEIGNLSNLCYLSITNNLFQIIPLELHSLRQLGTEGSCGGLYLDDYLLDTLPEEVANGGTSAVLNYLENQAWWHFQRMIVSAAAMIALPCAFILAWRWKNQRGKSKRKNEELG